MLKPLEKAVAAPLKLTFRQIEHYNFKTQIFYGTKRFDPAQNIEKVINAINEINSKNKAIRISTFYTLYTNIQRSILKSVLGQLTNFCCNSRFKEFTWITKYDTIWINNQQKHRFHFNKTF